MANMEDTANLYSYAGFGSMAVRQSLALLSTSRQLRQSPDLHLLPSPRLTSSPLNFPSPPPLHLHLQVSLNQVDCSRKNQPTHIPLCILHLHLHRSQTPPHNRIQTQHQHVKLPSKATMEKLLKCFHCLAGDEVPRTPMQQAPSAIIDEKPSLFTMTPYSDDDVPASESATAPYSDNDDQGWGTACESAKVPCSGNNDLVPFDPVPFVDNDNQNCGSWGSDADNDDGYGDDNSVFESAKASSSDNDDHGWGLAWESAKVPKSDNDFPTWGGKPASTWGAEHAPTWGAEPDSTWGAESVPCSDLNDPVQEVIHTLRVAQRSDWALHQRLKNIATNSIISEDHFAQDIVHKINAIINDGENGSSALRDAIDTASDVAHDIIGEYLGWDSIIADHVVMSLGVLVLVAPWVLEWLGFDAKGPRVGEFAFSFFQISRWFVCFANCISFCRKPRRLVDENCRGRCWRYHQGIAVLLP